MHKDELVRYIEADPRIDQWGILSSDPWPMGVSMFFWLPTEAELRERLADGSFDVDGEPEGWVEAAELMEAALASIKEISPADVDALDAATNGGFCIEWVGRFEDLFMGDSPTALMMRDRWRDDGETPADQLIAPIKAEEVAEFVEFVKAYGY